MLAQNYFLTLCFRKLSAAKAKLFLNYSTARHIQDSAPLKHTGDALLKHTGDALPETGL